MKQVLFILLLFISFQGFSQKSVKVQEIGLEVMTKDLGQMDWYDAIKTCDSLGNGWRLPTIDELNKMHNYKNKIGGFEDDFYWSTTESDYGDDYVDVQYFGDDWEMNGAGKSYYSYARAVRDLK